MPSRFRGLALDTLSDILVGHFLESRSGTRGLCAAREECKKMSSHLAVLVGPSGLEPPTSCLSGTRSNLLSYEPIRFGLCPHLDLGGDDGTRTHDPLLAKQVLSQLSYTPKTGRESPLFQRSAEPKLGLPLCWLRPIFPHRLQ